MRLFASLLLALALTGCASHGGADRIISLAGQWAFQPGDDLQWAAPGFNDASWARLQVPTSWGRQGYHQVTGLAWYRTRVSGPWPSPEIVGVILGKVDSAYELYIGGRLAGRVGKLPPNPELEYDRHGTYTVAPDMREPDGSFVVALRVWRAPANPSGSAGPAEGPYAAGPLQAVVVRETRSEGAELALVFVFFIAAVYHLGLRVMRPSSEEYGWFGLMAIATGFYCFFRTQWKYELFSNFVAMKKFEHVLLYLALASFAQFIYSFFHEPIPRWLRVSQGLLLAAAVVAVATPGLETTSRLLLFLYVMFTVMTLGMLWLTVSRMRAGERDARIIGLGTLVVGAAFANDALVGRSFYVGPRLGVWGFAVLVVGMSLTLAYRFNRALVEVESLRQDLETRVEMRTHELSAATSRWKNCAARWPAHLLNRRSLQERAMKGLAMSKRKKMAFALAMVDIDHFKTVNDTLGHAAGDQVLSQVAKRLTSCVRASDDVGRWGGEEFLVLFPESDPQSAGQAAERLRAVVSATPLTVEGDVELNVTVSVGVAVVDEPAPSPLILDALVRRADDALYAAKDGGRNQVVVAN